MRTGGPMWSPRRSTPLLVVSQQGGPMGRPYVDTALGPGDRQVHYLGYLPPGGVLARMELQASCPATVPGDDPVAIGGLYQDIERITGGHVPERRSGRGVEGPLLGQH